MTTLPRENPLAGFWIAMTSAMRARAWCPPTRPAPVGHRRVGAGRPAAVRLRPGHPVALPVPGHLGLPVAARGRPTATKQTPCSRPGRARHPTSGHASQPTRKGKSSAEPSRSTDAECSRERPPGPSLHRPGPGSSRWARRSTCRRTRASWWRSTAVSTSRGPEWAFGTPDRAPDPTYRDVAAQRRDPHRGTPRLTDKPPAREGRTPSGRGFTTADSPAIQPRPAPRWGRCGAPAASARSCCST
jgi:hypothetical protein